MKKKIKKILSVALILSMLFSVLPISGAFASGASSNNVLAPVSKEVNRAGSGSVAVGDLIKYGSYPQSKVTDSETLNSLNALVTPEDWVSYGYYYGTGGYGSMVQGDYMKYADISYSGNKYRAVTFTSYRPDYTYKQSTTTYQDDNGYSTNTVYWFKFEPIMWRVLDPATGLVLCESIIDSQAYSNTHYYISGNFYQNATGTTYANSYAKSSIRVWLNDDFYNTAFTLAEKTNIVATERENKASLPTYSEFDSVNTTDKVTLLSYAEVQNTAYGFISNTGSCPARYGLASDYAKAQGVFLTTSTNGNGNATWWTRSAGSDSRQVCHVSGPGNVSSFDISCTILGTRPAMNLPLNKDVEAVAVNEKTARLNIDEKKQLTAVITPFDAANQNVSWTSSNTDVATVSSTGLVTAIADGTAIITVTTENGGFTDTCTVTVYSIKKGEIMEFGSYPQSKVTDSTTVNALNALVDESSWVSYNYYYGTGAEDSMVQGDYMKYADISYNGNKYRGVTFKDYRPFWTCYEQNADNTYQDDNGYTPGNVYWFKYEPILWRVIDPATGLVLCETLIDAQAYSNTVYYADSGYYLDAAKTTYANNYALSSIREWLNSDFYNTAFSESEKELINATQRDNKAYGALYTQYNSNSTSDSVTLLTYADARNTSYDFAATTGESSTRYIYGSDYAKAQGLYTYTAEDINCTGSSLLWLRSAGNSSRSACYVYYGGYLYNNYFVNFTHLGVQPVLNLHNIINHNYPAAVSVESVSIIQSTVLAPQGECQLTAVTEPSNATNQNVSWLSSNSAVATVSETGLVSAIADGTAIITVATDDGCFTSTCTVTVTSNGEWQFNGDCIYYFANGSYLTGTKYINGVCYVFGNDGILQGNNKFVKIDNNVYYLISNKITKGYCLINNSMYYFNDNGVKFSGGVHDGYNFDDDGMLTDNNVLVSVNGNVYYFEENTIVTGYRIINNHIYYFGEDGAMYRSWIYSNYTFDEKGCMTGTMFIELNGKTYYILNGTVLTGAQIIDHHAYTFSDAGVLLAGPEHTIGEWQISYAPTCTHKGIERRSCIYCDFYETRDVVALGHIDSNSDNMCDRCNVQINPTPTPACTCQCHSSNGFTQFIWKIKVFFWKLFRVEANRKCACGDYHW